MWILADSWGNRYVSCEAFVKVLFLNIGLLIFMLKDSVTICLICRNEALRVAFIHEVDNISSDGQVTKEYYSKLVKAAHGKEQVSFYLTDVVHSFRLFIIIDFSLIHPFFICLVKFGHSLPIFLSDHLSSFSGDFIASYYSLSLLLRFFT